MANCCKYNFGLYPHNADLILDDLVADADGTYKVLVDMPTGSIKTIDIEAEAGDEIIIPQGELIESAVHNFQVLDIHGIPMTMTIPDTEEECENFTLKTYINLNLKCDGNNCNDSDDTTSGYGGSDGDY